jgi:hypothetical protein
MDYKKLYKKALERAREYWETDNDNTLDIKAKGTMEYLFPELVESKDERIRKVLIDLVKCNERSGYKLLNNVPTSSLIAWLEKQNIKQGWSEENERMKNIAIQACKYMVDNFENSTKQYEDAIVWLEKQGKTYIFEGKSVLEAINKEKIEPKFRVGDWILYSGDHYEGVRHITKIDENGYYIERYGLPHGIIPFNHEVCMRLWTINDARDGDILASDLCDSIILYKGIKDNNIEFYCDYDFSIHTVPGRDRFTINKGQHYGSVDDSNDWHPATKEQRDTLMKAMADSGYTFDFEKKELLSKDLEWVDMETNECHCYNCELFDNKNNVCKCIDLCKRPKNTYKGFYIKQ